MTAQFQAEFQAGGGRSATTASLSPSPEQYPVIGDWVAEERPCKKGGEKTWALSRRPSKGNASSASKSARTTPAPIHGRALATSGRDPRPGTINRAPSFLLVAERHCWTTRWGFAGPCVCVWTFWSVTTLRGWLLPPNLSSSALAFNRSSCLLAASYRSPCERQTCGSQAK